MRALIATLLAMALLAPAGSAKGPASAELCGASGCRSVDDRQIRDAPLADGEQISPPRAGPFFTVRFLLGGEGVMGRQTFDRFEATYLPSARAVRTTDERGEPVWRRMKPRAVRAYRKATWNLRPRPASRIGQMDDPIRAEVVDVYEATAAPVQSGHRAWRPLALLPFAAVLLAAVALSLRRRWKRTRRPVLFGDA